IRAESEVGGKPGVDILAGLVQQRLQAGNGLAQFINIALQEGMIFVDNVFFFAIIWVPAAIYLFATGQLWQGAFIVGFFVIVIGLVDNILRPLLVGKDTRMPDYLILIATLGGMEIYGINGFVIGPLIAALFIACWNLLSGREHAGNADEIDEEFIEEAKNSRNE
ncbi:AI-2E family transporter, partial [Staphylococcus aureus]|uniref:AI-2E family transporter n=1 Tax=Staphylococcus aureus TaxID=1280 RepID=UPI001BB0048B